mgnify:CR=1 FL=1
MKYGKMSFKMTWTDIYDVYEKGFPLNFLEMFYGLKLRFKKTKCFDENDINVFGLQTHVAHETILSYISL